VTKPKGTSNPPLMIGLCKGCSRRAVLGRCTFKGGRIDKMDHCRQCCDAPEVLKWKPSLAGAVMRIFKKKRKPSSE
jgi:hypothetical protein